MMGWVGVVGVWMYRWLVRPFLRRRCLYTESCSQFAIRTFREHGFVRGLGMVKRRVRSCRLPAAAAFVIDADGVPRLLSVTGHAGCESPPGLERLAVEAATAARARRCG